MRGEPDLLRILNSNMKKGKRTKKWVISAINDIYNAEGMNFTLDQLAAKLGVNRSTITNYFPRKDRLLLAILVEYERELKALIEKVNPDESPTDFFKQVHFYRQALEQMYRYRFVISYIIINPPADSDFVAQLRATYSANLHRLNKRIESFCRAGLLEPAILERENYRVFRFQYMNLSTTWPITHRLYEEGADFDSLKETYLRGVMACFKPFLTEKGARQLKEALDI